MPFLSIYLCPLSTTCQKSQKHFHSTFAFNQKKHVDFNSLRMDHRIAREAREVPTSWLPGPVAEGGCFLIAGCNIKESIRNGE